MIHIDTVDVCKIILPFFLGYIGSLTQPSDM